MSFTDSLIRRLNAACNSIECNDECDGIGWCRQSWEVSNAKANRRRDGGADNALAVPAHRVGNKVRVHGNRGVNGGA